MIAAVNPSYCISTCFEWQCVFQYFTFSFKMSWSDQEKSSEWVQTEGITAEVRRDVHVHCLFTMECCMHMLLTLDCEVLQKLA